MAHSDVPPPPGPIDPDDVGVADSTLACPKCSGAMARMTVGNVEIDRCRGCGGLWLDALERERLLEDTAAVQEADTGSPEIGRELDDEVLIFCPRDKSRMIHMVDRRQGHVGFESCKVCGGSFLDAGELRDLAHHTLLERLRGLFGR